MKDVNTFVQIFKFDAKYYIYILLDIIINFWNFNRILMRLIVTVLLEGEIIVINNSLFSVLFLRRKKILI